MESIYPDPEEAIQFSSNQLPDTSQHQLLPPPIPRLASDVEHAHPMSKPSLKRKRSPIRRRRPMKGERGPGGWNRGRKMPRIEPSEEFSGIYNEALSAFIDEDFEDAIDLCSEAIAVNPEVWAAHALLAQVFEAQGEEEKCALALYNGCVVAKTAEAWSAAAEAYLQATMIDREHALRQAATCYSNLVKINGEDFESYFKRATIHRELNSPGRALIDLNKILEHQPHNSSVLRLIAEICLDTQQIDLAKSKYEAYIEHTKASVALDEESFSWSDVNVYVELFAHSDDFAGAIFHLRSLARWLLGRSDETFWDEYVLDDREWDAFDDPRRLLSSDYIPGNHPIESYGDGLPLEIRAKIGIYRLRQGSDFKAEAFQHFDWLEPDDEDADAKVKVYPDLFLEVGNALRVAKEYHQALRFLAALRKIEALQTSNAWLAIAECYYIIEARQEAIECYEAAKSLDGFCAEARAQLTKLYTTLGNKKEALKNGQEAVVLRTRETPYTGRRRYERKDQRVAREEAEKALKEARKLKGPDNTRPRKRTQPRRLQPFLNTASPDRAVAGSPENNDFLEADSPVQTPFKFRQDKASKKLAAVFNTVQTQWQLDWDPPPEDATLTAPKPQPRKFVRKPKPVSPKEITQEEREAKTTGRVAHAYNDLKQYSAGMRFGEAYARNRWMQEADSMITEFRTNRILYPPDRHTALDESLRAETFGNKWGKDKHLFQGPSSSSAPFSNPDADEGSDVWDQGEIQTLSTYRNIPFEEWLDVFLEQALNLAKLDQKIQCYTVITAAQDCTVWYHDPAVMLRIYTVYFVCALTLRDGNTLFNTVCRWFMRTYQFCTDTYRLFAALNLHHTYLPIPGGKDTMMAQAPFRQGPSQKFMMRQVKAIDALLPSDYNIDDPIDGPVPAFMREELHRLAREEVAKTRSRQQSRSVSPTPAPMPTPLSDNFLPGQESTDPIPHRHRPNEMDVVLLTLYGHILYTAASYPNALSYFYRAYTIDPHNPTVLLSLSLSYVHQMFKRQNEDRHVWLLRGLAFFEEYVDARSAWAEEMDKERRTEGERTENVLESVKVEVEFNRARMWQMLGMGDLAMKGYAKVLCSGGDLVTPRNEDEVEDYSKEAAYAMQILYAMNGNMEKARQITEKYLVVE